MSVPPASAGPRRLVVAVAAIFIVGVITLLLAYPALTRAVDRNRMTETLANVKSVQTALQMMHLDAAASGESGHGLPADIGATSTREYLSPLVKGGYMSQGEFDRFLDRGILVANVSKDDPPETPFIVVMREPEDLEKGFSVFNKGGGGGVYKRAGDWDSLGFPDREPQVLPRE